MAEYPKRESHFAHKAVRLMIRTCAAQEMGSNACMLVVTIAHTEHAKWYTAPVTFWNDQLRSILAFNSWSQLDRARKRAVDAGWLHYEPGGKGKVGKYWVTIPSHFLSLFAGAVDEDHPSILSASGEDNGLDSELSSPPAVKERGEKPVILSTSGERTRGQRGDNEGTNGEHSYKNNLRPKPKPKPKPKEELPAEVLPEDTQDEPLPDADDFIHVWASTSRVHGIAAVRKWTPDRRAKIRIRLAQDGWWEAFQEAATKLPLPGDGWQPDADWFLANEQNVYKVLEGKYDWRQQKPSGPDGKPTPAPLPILGRPR